MRRNSWWTLVGILLLTVLVLGVSCAKKVVTMEAEPAAEKAELAPVEKAPSAEELTAAEAKARAEEEQRLREQQALEEARLREEAARKAEEARRRTFEAEDVHFDFDKYVLKPEAMRTLDDKAAWLREHPEERVLIEGHCDERGTNEYNLALGDRRANSALNYLVRAGVAENRLITISFGEERPFCTEHNEGCWWQNRRAHFVIR